jgi:hypothetical protein
VLVESVRATGQRDGLLGRWDKASLDAIRAELEAGARRFPNFFEKGMVPRGEADPEQRLYAAAAGWGLLPGHAATYFSYPADPRGHASDICRRATYQVPKNGAFWSITVYNSTGFIEYENSVLSSSNVKLNPDGTFAAFFGAKEACGDVLNRLDAPKGWNFMMQVYRPPPVRPARRLPVAGDGSGEATQLIARSGPAVRLLAALHVRLPYPLSV